MKNKNKIHYSFLAFRSMVSKQLTLCKKYIAWTVLHTDNEKKVTCKQCLKKIH